MLKQVKRFNRHVDLENLSNDIVKMLLQTLKFVMYSRSE